MNKPLAALAMTMGLLVPGERVLALHPSASEHPSPSEGFYPLDAPPDYRLREFALSQGRIDSVTNAVGKYLLERPADFDAEQVREYLDTDCKTSPGREWKQSLCERLASPACAQGCRVVRPSGCSGVLVAGSHFVTAMHCSEAKPREQAPKALLRAADGSIRQVELLETPMTHHSFPYDVSIYKVMAQGLAHPGVPLRTDDPQDGETVFGIGFPWIGTRENKAADYTEPNGEPRVTFGRVVYANIRHDAICDFSNSVDVARPETWRFEADCSRTDYQSYAYPVREQRDPFLTSTDMIYGMSGSPLFDREGRLLGVGTTILNSNPGDYDPAKHAVYIKSSNVAKLLGILAPSITMRRLDPSAFRRLEQRLQSWKTAIP